MDIWRWVQDARADLRQAGNERLATLLDRLPSYVCADDHARVDAVYPEALALAKAERNPWLEIFVRHWGLQSRVLHRHMARSSLTEAVSLVELAHREENLACPQSVCTTQDLTACYSAFDGPGYAAERMKVAGESLERISPEWPCFSCISVEYASALVDSGKCEQALAFLDEQTAGLKEGARGFSYSSLRMSRIDPLIELGRIHEALAVLDEPLAIPDGHQKTGWQLRRARVLAHAGQLTEAADALVPYDLVLPTLALYNDYVDAVERVAGDGAVANDWRLDGQLRELQARLSSNGVNRGALQAALARGRLAVARGREASSRECLGEARALLATLRAPHGADEKVAELNDRIVQMGGGASAPTPESPEAVAGSLGHDAEADLDALIAARERWPDSELLRGHHADALTVLRRTDAALAVLNGGTELTADDLSRIAALLTTAGRTAELVDLTRGWLNRFEDSDRLSRCHLFLANDLRSRGEWAQVSTHLTAILELTPNARNTQVLQAEALRNLGRPAEGLELLNAVCAAYPPGNWDWDRMALATIVGAWAAVRDSAARLDMSVEGDAGPIQQVMEHIKLRYPDPTAGHQDLWAVRTGPVTAQVIDMQRPGDVVQRYGDSVVFDASPITQRPDDVTPEQWVSTFRPIHRLAEGGWRIFSLDGVRPPSVLFFQLREALQDAGGRLQDRSGEHYTVRDAETNEEHAGLYAFLAVSEDSDPAEIQTILQRETAAWPHPCVWRLLALALDDEAELDRAAVVAQQYAIQLD